MQNDLSSTIADILNECLAKGMKPPLIVCAASPNGSLLAVRFSGRGGDPDILAEHYEAGVFKVPMTIMVLDQDNDAARITLDATGRTWH